MNLTNYIAILLAMLVGFAHGFDFADFVNDLHSDLAPLLTLFGEKVTMQFISQAMGPLDCVALALAPLGIITIMVSAIRVGGPTILKAIVGRAKENRAAAELELMSSTSQEVCELFNGQNIVRCLGSGSVWQYICLFRKGTGNGQVRFMTLQEATKEGLLIQRYGKTAKEPQENAPSSQGRNYEVEVKCTATGFAPRRQTTLQRMRRRVWKPVSKETDNQIFLELGLIRTAQEQAKETDKGSTEPLSIPEESSSVPKEPSSAPEESSSVPKEPSSAPEESSSIPKEPSSVPTEQDIGGPATIIVVYDAVPEAPNISLNLQHLGTKTRIWTTVVLGLASQTGVLVIFGMINYSPGMQTILGIDKPLSPYGFGMTFCGTLLMAIGIYLCADVVERSTTEEVYEANDQFGMRLYWLQQDQTVNDQVFQSFATVSDTYCTQFLKSRRAWTSHRKETSQGAQTPKELRTETCVGVGLGVVGFVTQFVGFRGLHPAAPLAQLVAIIFMTGFRAWARPGYTRNFQTAKLLHGFEQDWLAQQLAQYLITQQPDPTQQPAQQLSKSMDDGNKRDYTWSIVTGRDAEYRALKTLREGMGNHAQCSEAQRLLVMRRDVYRLVKFRTASSKCAVKLATAMERALGVLFPDGPRDGLGFRWVLDVDMTGAKQLVWIDLPFHQGDKRGWRVAAEDLHAALSLWMYTARVQEDEKEVHWYVEDEDGAWLCRDVCEPTLKALGEGNYGMREQVIQDLKIWTTQGYDVVREIEDMWGREERAKNESGRRLKPNCARAAHNDPRTRLGRRAAETDGSIMDLYVSEILFSFMWSLASTLSARVKGEVEIEASHDISGIGPQKTSQLRSTAVNDLINAFRAASCWSEHETCLGVISPLSIMQKLPTPQQGLKAISATIKDSLRWRDQVKAEEAWKQAFGWAGRLIQVCVNSSTSDRVVAWLLEQFHDFQDAKERAYEIPRLERIATGRACEILRRLIWRGAGQNTPVVIQRHVSIKGPGGPLVIPADGPRQAIFLTRMENLYELQGREMKFEFDEITYKLELPDSFDFTTLHEEAARGRLSNSSDLIGQRVFVNVQDVCGYTPLLYAAATKNWEMVESLLKMGADPALTDYREYTAVHHACLSGCLKSLKRLYTETAMNAQAMNGLTPMHLAAGKGNRDIIEFLLKETGDQLSRLGDFDGRTAAHWAAAGGHNQVVELLRADVNIPDSYGSTPLHLAAMDGNLAMVKKLLEVGAHVDVRNNQAETPLTYGIDLAKTEEDAFRMTRVLARCPRPEIMRGIGIARKRGFGSVESYLESLIGRKWWGADFWTG